MRRVETVPVGIVVERRAGRHPWAAETLTPVAVLPDAPGLAEWTQLTAGDGFTLYHAGTLTLELHRKEAESYRCNLSSDLPRLYVVLRRSGGASRFPYAPLLVTASFHEAEAYGNSGGEIVEGVPMPDSLIALLRTFIDADRADGPLAERDRRRADADAGTAPRRGGPRPPGGRNG